MVSKVSWGPSGKVYQAFLCSLQRHISDIDRDINDLHSLFLLQSGQLSKQAPINQSSLVELMAEKAVTLLSLEHVFDEGVMMRVNMFYQFLKKGICQFVSYEELNSDAPLDIEIKSEPTEGD